MQGLDGGVQLLKFFAENIICFHSIRNIITGHYTKIIDLKQLLGFVAKRLRQENRGLAGNRRFEEWAREGIFEKIKKEIMQVKNSKHLHFSEGS